MANMSEKFVEATAATVFSRLSAIVTPFLLGLIAYLGQQHVDSLSQAIKDLQSFDARAVEAHAEANRAVAVQTEQITVLGKFNADAAARIRRLEENTLTKEDATRLEKRIDRLLEQFDRMDQRMRQRNQGEPLRYVPEDFPLIWEIEEQ